MSRLEDDWEAKLDALIDQTRDWWKYHKRRGSIGQIEALGAQIRLRALLDVRRTLGGDGQ